MLVNFGVNYKTAPLAILDAVNLRDPAAFYQILKGVSGIRGVVILQTCNRVEFFLETEDGAEVADKVLWHWALETRFKLGELTRLVDRKQADSVIEHLVRLGSGLESMLVGESQILGQMKGALAEARSLKAASPLLLEAYERALSAASKIREQTGIERGAASLGSATLRLVEDTLGSLRDLRVLVLGTGQVGMLMMKALKARGITNVLVASRTWKRADSFARAYGGSPVELEKVPRSLSQLDVVVVGTRATNYLLTNEMIAPVLKNRRSKLMLVDLSTPRNISPSVRELDGVVLKTIEDLRGIADETLAKRRELVKKAEPLVRERVEAILGLIRRERAEPIVSDLYRRAYEIREEELGKALSKLKLTPEQQDILENMSLSLVEKLLGPSVDNLRRAAEKGDREALAVAGRIFGRSSPG